MERQWNQKKWIALTLLFCLILFLFLFIRSSAAERNQSKTSVSLGSLTVNGQPVEVSYVMKVDQEPVSLDEYRYYYFTEKALMSGADDSYFQEGNRGEKEERLKENTEHSLLRDLAVLRLAEQNGLKLSKSEKEQIDSDVISQIESLGGKDQYLKALAKVNMTDSIYRTQWKISYLYEKLYQYYFENGSTTASIAAILDDESDQKIESNQDGAADQSSASGISGTAKSGVNDQSSSKAAVAGSSALYPETGQKDSSSVTLLERLLDRAVNDMEISYGPAYDSIDSDTLK